MFYNKLLQSSFYYFWACNFVNLFKIGSVFGDPQLVTHVVPDFFTDDQASAFIFDILAWLGHWDYWTLISVFGFAVDYSQVVTVM